MRWLGLNVLFATAVCAAWSWYHVAAPTHRVSYRFQIQTNLLGWQFEPVEVPEIARRTLAGTNLFNGIYRGTAGERVAVFAGNWSAENSRELSVVGHTPDVCWVGSGWKPVSLGQPRQIPIGSRARKSLLKSAPFNLLRVGRMS